MNDAASTSTSPPVSTRGSAAAAEPSSEGNPRPRSGDHFSGGIGSIAWRMMSERTRATIYWLIGVSLLMVVMAAFYPSIRDSGQALDEYMNSLPEGMRKAFGLSGESLSSPEGYLVSQLYSNMYPVVLLILGFGMAGWSVAGSEADGTLELRGVPAGACTVSAWHEKGGEGERPVTVEPGGTTRVAVQLDASRWRPEKHKNKYGKDYPPPDDDENRY